MTESIPNLFAPQLEETQAMPAVKRTPPLVPEKRLAPAELRAGGYDSVAGGGPAFASTADLVAEPPAPLAPAPGPVDPRRRLAEWATDRLTPGGAFLHALACNCAWGGDVEWHDGTDFDELAARQRAAILAEQPDSAPAVVEQGNGPIEAKVVAATWGTFGMTLALGAVNLMLGQLGVLPSLLGGPNPWAGPVMLALSVLLPAAAAFIKGWLAVRTVRPQDAR